MRKTNDRKPLVLARTTVKSLSPEVLARAGGAMSYNGSVNIFCYASGLTRCTTCYP